MWWLLLLACKPTLPEPTDAPPAIEPWATVQIPGWFLGIVDTDANRMLLHQDTPNFDIDSVVLDLSTGDLQQLGEAGVGEFVAGTDAEVIVRPRSIDVLEAGVWVSHRGRVTGRLAHAWLESSGQLQHVHLPTRTFENVAGLPTQIRIHPLGDGSTAVIEETTGQRSLTWWDEQGKVALGTAMNVLAGVDVSVYADSGGQLFEAGRIPVPLNRALIGSTFELLADDIVLAETAVGTFEVWDGSAWTLLATDHTLAAFDSTGVVLRDADGDLTLFPTFPLGEPGIPLGLQADEVRDTNGGAYFQLVGPGPVRLLLPDGRVIELPPEVTGDTNLGRNLDEALVYVNLTGEPATLVDLHTTQLTRGAAVQSFCYGIYGGQLLYAAADGTVHRLTRAGDEELGEGGCSAVVPIQDGASLVLTDRRLARIDPDGFREDLGAFVHISAVGSYATATAFANAGNSFENFGRGSVTLFDVATGRPQFSSTFVAVDFFGDVVEPVFFGPDHVGFYSPGSIGGATSDVEIKVQDRSGQLVQVFENVVGARGYGEGPHHLVRTRIDDEPETLVVTLPE